MSDNIIQLNEDLIKHDLKDLVRSSVEETLNALLDKEADEHIESWRTRSLSGNYPYVYVDGVYLKCSWGGEIQNVSILVAIGVNQDGCREIKRRTKAIGAFPDRQSALMLVCARLRHVVG